MNLERYEYDFLPDRIEYEFYSVGPKGRIKKVVRFQPFTTGASDMFNLAFGDWDEKAQTTNDIARSNNGDINKVLATVSFIVLDFTEKFPNAKIFASGMAERNRLYRMNISRQLLPIYAFFHISGLTEDNVIEPFTKNKDYIAFIVKRRNLKRNFQPKS